MVIEGFVHEALHLILNDILIFYCFHYIIQPSDLEIGSLENK